MPVKRVIVTGAGFSAPAKLPIQNQIITKMTEKITTNFWSDSVAQESIRFIQSYIKVGIFLLDNYAKHEYSKLRHDYECINDKQRDSKVIANLFNQFATSKIEVGIEALELMRKSIFDDTKYYAQISVIRENVRKALEDEKINVNLEDIFTSFDKTIQTKEYIHKYSYAEMDEIRHAIMRLFVYYFSKSTIEHNYIHQDYLSFMCYIKSRRSKKPVTIITTNWDALLEEYLTRGNLDFNLSFQEQYYIIDGKHTIANISDGKFKLLKLHGSINWLRCLNCNTLSITENEKASKFLFHDEVQEMCQKCKCSAPKNSILLQPEIITPTMMKSINNQLYHNLWSSASGELMNATHIIFVGYSLPIADYEFRYLLQKSVPTNAKIDIVLYKNDNPAQTPNVNLKELLPEKRYRDLFPKNDICFHYNGFGEFFK